MGMTRERYNRVELRTTTAKRVRPKAALWGAIRNQRLPQAKGEADGTSVSQMISADPEFFSIQHPQPEGE